MHLPACEDGTECSETPAYKIQTPGNYPEESIQHPEHGASLKSRKQNVHKHIDVFRDYYFHKKWNIRYDKYCSWNEGNVLMFINSKCSYIFK